MDGEEELGGGGWWRRGRRSQEGVVLKEREEVVVEEEAEVVKTWNKAQVIRGEEEEGDAGKTNRKYQVNFIHWVRLEAQVKLKKIFFILKKKKKSC